MVELGHPLGQLRPAMRDIEAVFRDATCPDMAYASDVSIQILSTPRHRPDRCRAATGRDDPTRGD
jgi:hypothetical protein